MRRQLAAFVLALQLTGIGVLHLGCQTSVDSRYCDDTHPCRDPQYPRCDVAAKTCVAAADGAVAVTDAGTDGGLEGGLADAAGDSGGDAAVNSGDAAAGDAGGEGGCPVGQHPCGDGCFAPDDPDHCGAACLACTGETPECDGTTCVCNGASCTTGTVCAAGACVAGNCTRGEDCVTPPECRTADGATCNSSHVCEYPVAADDSACAGGGHCCTGACVPNDVAHCGPSCQACSPPSNADPVCDSGGLCDFQCHAGFYRSGTGCAVCDVVDHCGASCGGCTAPVNASAQCVAGDHCDFTCDAGWIRNAAGTGCDPCITANHCGASCMSCTAPANAIAVCWAGDHCDFQCITGWVRNAAGTGCDPCNTTAHCGVTCVQCSAPSNAMPICTGGGQCDFACNGGYYRNGAQCDACVSDAHCGSSCIACGGNQPHCSGAACVCTLTSCPTSTPICDVGGACRTCSSHAECEQRDPQNPLCFSGTCHPSVCGDGYVDTARGERCDDGNTNNHDGCDPTCRYTGTIGAVAGFFGANGGAYCDENGIYARFKLPSGVAVSGTSVFVADTLSHTIRRLDTTSGAVTLFAGRPFISGSADGAAGQATFNQPVGVATDGTYVYVADAGNQLVRRVQISDGSTLTIAGAAGVAGSADGVGTSARFNGPVGVAYYNNSLFVADLWNCTIRQISTSGFGVTTYAGTAGECGYSDVWPGRFNHPWGLAVGPDGLYVADTDNSVIRRIYSQFNPSPWPGHIDWFVTTPYGTAGVPGHADGNGASATFDHPHTLTAAGNTLFAADTNNHTIRALDTTGSRVVTTLAGSPGVGQWGDGTGAVARFKLPYGIAASGTDLFVSEWNNYDLRRVAQAGGGTVTLAGHAPMAGSYDGTTAEFRQPGGLSIEANGKLLVGDVGNCTLREVTLGSPASVATLAGVAGTCNVVDGVGSAAHFKTAQWPLVAGPLAYVADGWDIRSVTLPGAAVTRIAGSASGAGSADNATGLSATFTTAQSVAADASYLYVADQCAIRRVALASPNEVKTIIGVVGSAGAADGAGSAARLCGSTALPFVSLLVVGTTLYVSDTSNFTVRAVDLSNPNGPYSIHTLAGYVGSPGWMDGTGASARFTWPVGLAYDGQSLFVADRELIRQIADLDAMSVTTLTGRSGCQSAVPGDYQHAALNTATGLAYSPQTGYLYVADYAENLVREIR